MTIRSRLFLRATFAALVMGASVVPSLAADEELNDVPGGKDHPVLSRFAGSTLVGFADFAFEQATFPLSKDVRDHAFVKPQVFEGKVTRLAYLAPIGKSPLEVARSYEDALTKAGLVKKFSCAKTLCSSSGRIQEPFIDYQKTMKQVQHYGGYSSMAFIVLNTSDDPYYFWGTLKSGGRDVVVSVFTSRISAVERSPLNGRAGTFIEIVEPKPMETGQVTVDAGAMEKGLATEGRIALYGIYFDTGKAEVKPESKTQLDEMAKLIGADKALKVFIVGHTDNQGPLDANLALSQRRAEAIVAALAGTYKIDAKRLAAKGVASFAPVASNDAEEGRARNRRVELVKQ